MEEYNFSSNGIESKVTFFYAVEYLTITLPNTKNKFFLNKLITNVALNKMHFSLHFYFITVLIRRGRGGGWFYFLFCSAKVPRL